MLRMALSSISVFLAVILTGEVLLAETISSDVCAHHGGLFDSLELPRLCPRRNASKSGRVRKRPVVKSIVRQDALWHCMRDPVERTAIREHGSLPASSTSYSLYSLRPESWSLRTPSNVLDTNNPRQKREQDRGGVDVQNVASSTSPLNPLFLRLSWVLSAVTAPLLFLAFFYALKSHLMSRRVVYVLTNRREGVSLLHPHRTGTIRWVDRGMQSGVSHLSGHTSRHLLDEDFDMCTCSSEGLSDYEIAAIPIETHVSCRSGYRIPSESCSICLEGLNDGDRIKQLPLCKHSFHPECIDSWLHRSATCPLCRRSISERRTMAAVSIVSDLETSWTGIACPRQMCHGEHARRIVSEDRRLPCALPRLTRWHRRCARTNDRCYPQLTKTHRIASYVVNSAAPGVYPLFAASLIYVVPFYTMMIVFPHFPRTRKILSSSRVLLPLVVAYAYLLAASWQPDTLHLMMPGDMREGFKGFHPQFFPRLDAIQILFSRLTTAASLWVHIVAVNFVIARNLFLDGLVKRIPTRHSCFLAMFAGPLAILSATITEMFRS